MVLHIGEADDALFVDHERGTFRHAAHDEVSFREKLLVSHAVSFRDVVFVIAEQGQGDAFFLRPSFWAKGLSPEIAKTFASSASYALMPWETSQSSVVQTPVNAIGTNRSTILDLPISSLSLTSAGPVAVLVTRVKSGAGSPTLMDMMVGVVD